MQKECNMNGKKNFIRLFPHLPLHCYVHDSQYLLKPYVSAC